MWYIAIIIITPVSGFDSVGQYLNVYRHVCICETFTEYLVLCSLLIFKMHIQRFIAMGVFC